MLRHGTWLMSMIILAFCLRFTRIGISAERVIDGDTPSGWTARMRSASNRRSDAEPQAALCNRWRFAARAAASGQIFASRAGRPSRHL